MRRLLLSATLVAAVLAGCGADEPRAPAATPVRVALDFTPNAVHAPLYAAADAGADRRHGIRLEIRRPGSGPDGLKLVTAGRVDVAILDIQDLGLARLKGTDVKGFGALVQRPLGALIAQPGIDRPRDLDGRTVGVSGLPSDPAFLRSIVEADGGRYESIRQVTIGFKAVSALLTRKVDAVPAFWSSEGVVLRRRGRPVREFRIEDYGAPPYPEVVFVASSRAIEERPERLRAFLATVADGIAAARRDPDRATSLVARAAGEADEALVRAQLDAVAPLFQPPVRLDRRVLEQWSAFAARIGILSRAPAVDAAFAFEL